MRAEGEWKVCYKCKVKKRLWDFHKDKTRIDGLHCLCRQCRKAYQETNKANAIANVRIDGNKVCTKCGFTKPISDFSHHSTKKDGRNIHCKPCRAEISRAYRKRMLETNPELYRERNRESCRDWYWKNEGWLVVKLSRQQKQQEKGL